MLHIKDSEIRALLLSKVKTKKKQTSSTLTMLIEAPFFDLVNHDLHINSFDSTESQMSSLVGFMNSECLNMQNVNFKEQKFMFTFVLVNLGEVTTLGTDTFFSFPLLCCNSDKKCSNALLVESCHVSITKMLAIRKSIKYIIAKCPII
jgi:hypothetical protein